jgi:hypothetical protein
VTTIKLSSLSYLPVGLWPSLVLGLFFCPIPIGANQVKPIFIGVSGGAVAGLRREYLGNIESAAGVPGGKNCASAAKKRRFQTFAPFPKSALCLKEARK